MADSLGTMSPTINHLCRVTTSQHWLHPLDLDNPPEAAAGKSVTLPQVTFRTPREDPFIKSWEELCTHKALPGQWPRFLARPTSKMKELKRKASEISAEGSPKDNQSGKKVSVSPTQEDRYEHIKRSPTEYPRRISARDGGFKPPRDPFVASHDRSADVTGTSEPGRVASNHLETLSWPPTDRDAKNKSWDKTQPTYRKPSAPGQAPGSESEPGGSSVTRKLREASNLERIERTRSPLTKACTSS
ncbi:MAG: hypothetical protein L6R40_004743 [Gallowayella cf. fulva]|nr:MAG: hypothetical protein L6R40_004743 [Xanthomendoza cf. fulva]